MQIEVINSVISFVEIYLLNKYYCIDNWKNIIFCAIVIFFKYNKERPSIFSWYRVLHALVMAGGEEEIKC